MELQTKVDIEEAPFGVRPTDRMLFVGSCFADNIGKRFTDDHFTVTVNPYGVMYNPASVLHTVKRAIADNTIPHDGVDIAVFTLGTNHVYILNETGEIVDNCQKRPQHLFTEKELTVDECASYLQRAIDALHRLNADTKVILTVSPIRYRKYGYHGSQLSKATLLLATQKCVDSQTRGLQSSLYPLQFPRYRGTETPCLKKCVDSRIGTLAYFPAYEIMNDELRDYRFYQPDMLHPSEQAVDYIHERFMETYFGEEAHAFVREWRPIRRALSHRPFNAEDPEYKKFLEKAKKDESLFLAKWKI